MNIVYKITCQAGEARFPHGRMAENTRGDQRLVKEHLTGEDVHGLEPWR
jgi:hypothetical protein